MKKTFRLLGVALVATAMVFVGCNKNEDEEEEEEYSLEVNAPETPSNKSVLIEEFTGTGCGYCPDGHKMVNDLMAANPGKVFGVNIHTGTYANRYTTSFGDSIDIEGGRKGSYPSISINRHVFTGTTTSMNRSYTARYTNQALSMPACANIAAKAAIDKSTRELTVNVAVYYTGTPTGTTNRINVAILEDSIWGPQSDYGEGDGYNPTQWNAEHTQYCHMHMLRHLVTGQWGDAITPVVGQQIKKEYKYTLPATISNVTVVPEHLHLVVFLCEGHQEVINSCAATIKVK